MCCVHPTEQRKVASFHRAGLIGLRRFRFLRRFFLYSGNVQAGYDYAALIIEPHDDPAALGINGGVIGARDSIPIPADRDNDERLEGSGLQKMTNVSDHARQPTRMAQRGQAGVELARSMDTLHHVAQ